MTGQHTSLAIRVVCVVLSPVMMVFGLYVVAHGHYGPGGGFAGGIVLGVGFILLRIGVPRELSYRVLSPTAARVGAALGVLAYVGIGVAALVGGGDFLDYSAIDALGSNDPDRRYLGILLVEAAVGAAVAGVMVTLFDTLVGEDG